MAHSSGPFRFLLFILAVVVTAAATLMGVKLGYGLLVLVVIAGLSVLLVFISLMMRPTVRSNRRSRLGPADSGIITYVAAPMDIYPGYCWQCGRRVKPDSIVCLRCGAAQSHRQAPEREMASEPEPWEIPPAPRVSGGMTRWDPTQDTPTPWGAPPSVPPAPPSWAEPPWQQPPSVPHAPQPPASARPAQPRRAPQQPPREPAREPRRLGARQVAQRPPAPPAPQASPAQQVAPRYRPGAPPPWMPQQEPAPIEPTRKRPRR